MDKNKKQWNRREELMRLSFRYCDDDDVDEQMVLNLDFDVFGS